MHKNEDQPLFLVRVVSQHAYQALQAAADRILTSTLGFKPELEFPGVCASLVTRNTWQSAVQTLYPGDVMLLLGVELLEQHNYHLNINDGNGYIVPDTVFPWQLPAFLRENKLATAIAYGDDFMGTEVVFHDPIPWRHVCRVLDKSDPLPTTQLRSPRSVRPNLELLPFFALTTRHHTCLAQFSQDEFDALTAMQKRLIPRALSNKDELSFFFQRHKQNLSRFKRQVSKRAS